MFIQDRDPQNKNHDWTTCGHTAGRTRPYDCRTRNKSKNLKSIMISRRARTTIKASQSRIP